MDGLAFEYLPTIEVRSLANLTEESLAANQLKLVFDNALAEVPAGSDVFIRRQPFPRIIVFEQIGSPEYSSSLANRSRNLSICMNRQMTVSLGGSSQA